MTNRYNIDDGNGNTINNMNENWKQEYLGIEYAPSKCKHFCMGDCCIQYQENGDFKSCYTDYPECKLAEPKEQTNEKKKSNK